MGLHWPNFVVAIEPAGQIIGCAQIKLHQNDARELASLVVLQAWRRQGVARQLIDYCQQNSGPPLWLMCRANLAPFYRRFGFEVVNAPSHLPSRLRRIRRLASLLERLPFKMEGPAIMRWPSPQERANTG